MANTKMIGALLGTLAFGSMTLAHAEDAPAPAKEKGKKEKGAKKEKGGEKSCSGEKGCSGKK